MGVVDKGGQSSLTAEERKRLVEEIANCETASCIERQRAVLTHAVKDIQQHTKGKSSIERKRYACRVHCQETGLTGDNYCVAIQFSSLYKAGKDCIPGNDNPLCLKTVDNRKKSPMCKVDSVGCSASVSTKCSMAYYASGGYVENSTCNNNGKNISYDQRIKDKSIKVSSFVDASGHVKKDASGKPKLKDGDLMYIEVGKASNTSTGLHCVRVNVDAEGKVTYTGGNNERVNAPFSSYYYNKPVAVFHTSEYAKDCFEYQLNNMNDKDLLKMAEKNKIELHKIQKEQDYHTRDGGQSAELEKQQNAPSSHEDERKTQKRNSDYEKIRESKSVKLEDLPNNMPQRLHSFVENVQSGHQEMQARINDLRARMHDRNGDMANRENVFEMIADREEKSNDFLNNGFNLWKMRQARERA